MRTQAALAVIAILGAGVLLPATGSAQSNPTADQIIKSLKPTGTQGATRGIRVAPAEASARPQSPAIDAPSVSLSVQFASGSAMLTPPALQVLDRLGQALTDPSLATYRFRIEGHTDTVGSRESNQVLSDQRAAVVADYLVSKFHVDRARVQTVGMGEDGLLIPTPNQTPEPRNRRVQVVNLGS